jgi:hypothetical protein
MARFKSAGKFLARPQFYDRNPAHDILTYEGNGVAPHAATQRDTYTVPTGKKAFIGAAEVEVVRQTAASTAGRATIYIRVTPYGGSGTVLIVVGTWKNAVGDDARLSIGQSICLYAGDVVDIYTSDGSTGGTVDYRGKVHLTIFDA